MFTRMPARRRSLRATIGVVVLGVVGGLLLPLSSLQAAPEAEAATATGGVGRFTQSIEWFEWGAPNSAVSNGTRTNTTTVAGQQLTVSCTIANLSGALVAYRPGTWRGDALDDLYNSGSSGTANRLDVGLATRDDGATVTFNVNCSARLGTQPLPLGGLVFADAEQSRNTEFVGATAPDGSTWRIIDRHRDAACTQGTTAVRPNGNPTRLELHGATASSDCGSGPAAVAFVEGAQSLTNVTVRGSGKGAIALGVMLSVDFGDAPEGYGHAGAIFQPGWSGGTTAAPSCVVWIWGCDDGRTNLFGSFALAATSPIGARLGAQIDADAQYPAAPPGTADDRSDIDDEDTLFTYRNGANAQATTAAALDLLAVPGSSQNVAVTCVGTGAAVRGWLDFDRNGTFDADERSSAATCASNGSAALSWVVPGDAQPATAADPTFLRVRIASAASVLTATGLTTSGEVEDHPVALAVPALTVTKTTDVPTGGAGEPGDVVRYTVVLRNSGRTPLTSPTIEDDLSRVLDGATFGSGTATAVASDGAHGTVTRSGSSLGWSRSTALPVGATVTLAYSVTLTEQRRGQQLENIAVGAATPPIGARLTSEARATTPIAVTLEVRKLWIVDGRAYDHRDRPAGLDATATAYGPNAGTASTLLWNQRHDGYLRGSSVTVAETTTIADAMACTLVEAEIAYAGTSVPLHATGRSLTLTAVHNVVTITNTIDCDTRLTLVKGIGFGSADAAAWMLSATDPNGNGISGAGTATGQVAPSVAYVLTETGTTDASALYVQEGAWICVDADVGQPVDVVDGAAQVPLGTHAECTVTNSTAQLVLLKHIDPVSGGTLQAAQFSLTATAADAAQLGIARVEVEGSETVSAANTFEVRPGHDYALSESSQYAYLGVGVERFVDGEWVVVDDPSAVQVPQGERHVYRFVNTAPPALALPLTGGIGADTYLFGGAGVLLLGLLVAAALLVRTRIRSSRSAERLT